MYERQVRLMWLRLARERHVQGKIITHLRQNWLRLSGRRFLWRYVLFPLVALALLALGLLWPRLQLEARRLGCSIRVRNACAELRELIELSGLDDVVVADD